MRCAQVLVLLRMGPVSIGGGNRCVVVRHRSVSAGWRWEFFVSFSVENTFQSAKYFTSHCCSELGEEGKSCGHAKYDVVQKDDVEVAQPLHASKATNKVEIRDTCKQRHQHMTTENCFQITVIKSTHTEVEICERKTAVYVSSKAENGDLATKAKVLRCCCRRAPQRRGWV